MLSIAGLIAADEAGARHTADKARVRRRRNVRRLVHERRAPSPFPCRMDTGPCLCPDKPSKIFVLPRAPAPGRVV
jgi:hypothetical protein